MNERLVVLSFTDGEDGVTLGDNYRYTTTPMDLKVVYVTASASANDADLTIDINDDGSGVITAVDASDADAPGTWVSTHFHGDETPVRIAADSDISFDANDAAAGTRIHIEMWCLTGSGY